MGLHWVLRQSNASQRAESPVDMWSEHYFLLWYFFSGMFCVIIVDLWRWLGTVTNSCCIWELRAILSPADAFISACLCAFHRWLESPLTHTLESTESERAGLENSLVVVCCCWIFFFLSGLFPPCVALFPVCSVSCLSNDHFEAVSLSCVILQTHGVYVQIFPHTAWVKGDRKKKTWGRKKSKPDAGWASSPTQKAV